MANERADLVVAARAGTTVANVSSLLASQGQFVPFDAPRPHHATIGGTLAAGWLGPRRHRYGRLRDYVIGSTIVLADGTVARAGGMVVKNVAGYDMSRLYVGSFGTLGVLVRANLKTVPLAPHARLFVASLPEQTRSRACAQLGALRLPPSAAFWIDGFDRTLDGEAGDEGRILVLLEGSEALLERATLELRSALGRAGVPETQILDAGAREAYERVVDAYVACMGDRSVTYRLYPAPEESERCALSLHELARQFGLRSETIVDVMNGDVVVAGARRRRPQARRGDRVVRRRAARIAAARAGRREQPSAAPVLARLGQGSGGRGADARAQGALRSESHAQPRPFRRRNLRAMTGE